MGKALVTGAAGFIGSHVVKELVAADCEVRAFVRSGEDRGNIRGLDIEITEGDIRDPSAVERAMAGIDTVYQKGQCPVGLSGQESAEGPEKHHEGRYVSFNLVVG